MQLWGNQLPVIAVICCIGPQTCKSLATTYTTAGRKYMSLQESIMNNHTNMDRRVMGIMMNHRVGDSTKQ